MVRFERTLRKTSVLGLVAGALAAAGLAGCSAEAATPTLTWYVNPDNGGQASVAQKCAEESGGAYQVQIETLPNDATSQREQLVRRLAAEDSSIDVMSLDVIYTAEFANAGFLLPFSEEEAAALTNGMLEAPVETATWKDTLYAAPFKSNAQLLWFRKSLAEKAGVDPTDETFTWDDMQKAAVAEGGTITEQGARYEGFMVWVNALILSGGGDVRGHEKVPTGGQVEVPIGGQVEVPTLRVVS